MPTNMSRRSVCLFDLDDTLYRSDTIHCVVRKAIECYIEERLGVPSAEVSQLTNDLYVEYGTTLAGLVAKGYSIDFDDWHRHVHYGVIDYDTLILPDTKLRAILSSIDLPKYVFTNADTVHAEKCLERLGIRDLFEGVIDFEYLMEAAQEFDMVTAARPVICKPMSKAYELVLQKLGVTAHETFFADDSGRNASAAYDLGICTVFIGRDCLPEGVRAHVALPTLHSLPQVLPRLLGFEQPSLSPAAVAALSAEAPPERVESGVTIEVQAS